MSTSASPSSFAPLGNNGPQDTTAEWEKLFQAPVEEDDPIWKVYIAEAAAFDNRMIDQWNKVIDVVLVYVSVDHFAQWHWQLTLAPYHIGCVVPFRLSGLRRRNVRTITT